MRKVSFLLIVLFVILSMGTASGQNMPDLKIEDLKIDPMPSGAQGPKLQLHMSRSYRFQVTIRNAGNLPASNCFVVKTECIKQGNVITLGEAVVGQRTSPYIYAVYDVFPSSAGAGDCILRTIVDADQSVNESNESPLSNIWDRGATILP